MGVSTKKIDVHCLEVICQIWIPKTGSHIKWVLVLHFYSFIAGCHMISTIKVHQPPPTPNPATRGATTLPTRRLEQLQYLDLTDCTSLEDTGLKMVVESCPQLLYLFLRRCTTISGKKNENTKVYEGL